MDIFSLDSILELIDKSKSKIKKELDMKILDNDKLSLESDNLLQVLDYTPKTRYSEKELLNPQPIKIKSIIIEKKSPKKNKHLKLVSTPNIDIDSLALNKNNLQNSNFGNKLESIEKNKEISDKKEKEEKKEENDDEEDEEYEKQFAQRQKQIEEREMKKKLRDDKSALFQNKTSKALNKIVDFENFEGLVGLDSNKKNEDTIKIDVYLFNTKEKIEIKITKKNKVKEIKKQILGILNDKKHNLKYSTYKAYNITIIESNLTINNTDNPIDDNLILYDLNPKSISFIENKNYETNNEKISNDIKKAEIKIEKIDIKINYNINGSLKTKIINISSEDNLKSILNIFFEEKIFEDKNIESYYFIQNNIIQEMEKAINLETTIKNLPSHDLNLYHKDEEENNDEVMLFISDEENNNENENEREQN
jgi:hypothetical protein